MPTDPHQTNQVGKKKNAGKEGSKLRKQASLTAGYSPTSNIVGARWDEGGLLGIPPQRAIQQSKESGPKGEKERATSVDLGKKKRIYDLGHIASLKTSTAMSRRALFPETQLKRSKAKKEKVQKLKRKESNKTFFWTNHSTTSSIPHARHEKAKKLDAPGLRGIQIKDFRESTQKDLTGVKK